MLKRQNKQNNKMYTHKKNLLIQIAFISIMLQCRCNNAVSSSCLSNSLCQAYVYIAYVYIYIYIWCADAFIHSRSPGRLLPILSCVYFSFVWSECLCVRVPLCVCVCVHARTLRDKILRFKNTFIIIIFYGAWGLSKLELLIQVCVSHSQRRFCEPLKRN